MHDSNLNSDPHDRSNYINSLISTAKSYRLRIIVDDTHMPVRDFASYLNLIDRSYGRLTPDSLASYLKKTI